MNQSPIPSMLDDVAEFHTRVLLCTAPAAISIISEEFALDRFAFMAEETNEYLEAASEGDIVKAVDGLLDTIYVALGTLWYMNIPVQECWDAVHRANMKKVLGPTKRDARRHGPTKDAMKPEGWVGPESEIAAAIMKRINESLG